MTLFEGITIDKLQIKIEELGGEVSKLHAQVEPLERQLQDSADLYDQLYKDHSAISSGTTKLIICYHSIS